MKETIVYLPMPHTVKEGDTPVFIAHEVYHALDNAGVKFTQETPEELKIRMMSLQIEELKRAYLELQDQNEALKMTARTAQERLDAVLGEYKQ